MSIISDLIESINGSLIFSHTTRVDKQNSIVVINIFFLNTLDATIRYFYDADLINLIEYMKNKKTIVPDFSTITNEEIYFQQMTISDCTMFSPDEVLPFMTEIKRTIIRET